MKKDTSIQKDNISETMREAVQNAREHVRDIELQAKEVQEEERALERELLEAQLAEQQKQEAAEKGQETEQKIHELSEG